MTVFVPSIQDLFEKKMIKFWEKTALKYDNTTVCYSEIWNKSTLIKRNILSMSSIKEQPRVGILMNNSPEYVITELAIIRAGAIRIGINTLLSKSEIEYILKDSETDILFIDKQYLETIVSIEPTLPNLKQIIITDECDYFYNKVISWDRYLKKPKNEKIEMRQVKPTDISIIAYTGGTTGKSKGVVITQEILFMILTSHIIETELKSDDHLLLMTPFAHSAGMIMLTGLLVGATTTIKEFDVKTFIHEIEKGITFTFMVPTMIYRVLDYIQTIETNRFFDFSSLKTILYGAAPITEDRLKEGIDNFGSVFMQLYGQTESYNFITKLTKDDHNNYDKTLLQSCGQAVYMSQVKIVDEKGRGLKSNEVGEVLVKSPYNMAYYLNKEKETKETLKDGWLYTGDIGYLNDKDYLFLLDRKNDMVITGGLNVYTTEVENALQGHSKVSQVAVLGRVDPDWGEKVVAVIIPNVSESLTEKELKIFISNKLAKYKQPKEYHFLSQLPVTPFGKVNKRLLKEIIEKDD